MAEPRMLSTNTSVTLGAAVAIVTTLFGVGLYIERKFNALDTKLEVHSAQQEITFREIATELAQLKMKNGDAWTLAQQAEYALRLAMQNPSVRVPDPRSPGQYLQANKGP